MKKMKLFFGVLITFMLSVSCSKDDTNVTNGFTLNGTFYETNFARASKSNPYYLIFYNSPNRLNEDYISSEGQIGYFILRSGAQGDRVPLIKGTYSTKNGSGSIFGIDSHYPISFLGEEGNSIHTGYWSQDENFKSGTVTINSISSSSDESSNQVTEIDVDYTFQWNGTTVKGNYSGKVIPD